MGNHHADTGYGGRAQQAEPGSDPGSALQDNLSGRINAAYGI